MNEASMVKPIIHAEAIGTFTLKSMSLYIMAKFRNVTKNRNLPREHSERI